MWTEINKKYLTLFFWKKLSHNFCFHYCLQIVSQGIVGLGSDVPFCQDCVRICTTLILTINNKGWGHVRVQSHSFGSHSSWPPGSSIHGNSPGKDTGVVATPFSRALPDPGIKPVSLAISRRILDHYASWEAPVYLVLILKMFRKPEAKISNAGFVKDTLCQANLNFLPR